MLTRIVKKLTPYVVAGAIALGGGSIGYKSEGGVRAVPKERTAGLEQKVRLTPSPLQVLHYDSSSEDADKLVRHIKTTKRHYVECITAEEAELRSEEENNVINFMGQLPGVGQIVTLTRKTVGAYYNLIDKLIELDILKGGECAAFQKWYIVPPATESDDNIRGALWYWECIPSIPKEICDDGIDNDCDHKVDDEDSDCGLEKKTDKIIKEQEKAKPMFPLAVGNKWTYDFHFVDDNGDDKFVRKTEMSVRCSSEFEGEEYFLIKGFYVRNTGDVIVKQDEKGLYFMQVNKGLWIIRGAGASSSEVSCADLSNPKTYEQYCYSRKRDRFGKLIECYDTINPRDPSFLFRYDAAVGEDYKARLWRGARITSRIISKTRTFNYGSELFKDCYEYKSDSKRRETSSFVMCSGVGLVLVQLPSKSVYWRLSDYELN